MKLKYTTIIVNDIRKSTEFYMENFNLKKIEEYEQKNKYSMVMLTDGHNVIELIENKDEAKISSIGFEVDNLKKHIKKLEKEGIEFIKKPKNVTDYPFASFLDPNGLLISLTQKIN